MKHLLLVAFAISSHTLLFSQRVILQDDFSGNKNNWTIKTSGADQAQIVDGKYVLEGLNDSTQTIAIPAWIDANKNFTVSVSATHLSGLDNYAYGITIGNGERNHSYSFTISAIGFYKFAGYEGGKYRQFIDWTSHASLKKGSDAENTISISKEGTSIKLYLNSQLVATIPNINLPAGSVIGLTRSNKQKVAFDNLTVSE